MTYRVEVSRDETRASGGVAIQITAYIDRIPETDDAGFERLTRVPKGVWNSRLLFSGDFAALPAALAAIAAAFPEVREIGCYEWPLDYEYPLEMPPLHRSGDRWSPGEARSPGPPPQLDWRVG